MPERDVHDRTGEQPATSAAPSDTPADPSSSQDGQSEITDAENGDPIDISQA